ncbi:type II toxin-antitoxin system RelE/ParE family toxin [Pseudomonas sp. R2.Fl]|nr:type II toxin-antitoxin system RelE/ParE family toxin [Pseudomonas sp. R2.Fl]
MAYEIRRSKDSIRDLDSIFDHLVSAYLGFGDEIQVAYRRAGDRVRGIAADIRALADQPYRGTVDPGLGFGLRHVTMNNAVVYFRIDETAEVVHVLAVFFGGQDHQRHMLKRLS